MPTDQGTGHMSEGNTNSGKGPILQFKITLKGIRPPIWRRILVPEWISLSDLHDVIQEVMGWWNSHLHEFVIKRRRYGVPNPEWGMEGIVDEETVTIKDLGLSAKNKIHYEYDFGDGWEHELLLEKLLPGDERMLPVCLKGARACPPEDCGGAWGYENLLEILKDPEHDEYATRKEWLPDDFDPEQFDLDRINRKLSSRKWSPVSPSRKGQ